MEFERCTIEVSGLKYAVSKADLDRALAPRLHGLLSISYIPRSGKAQLEVDSRAHAEANMRSINATRDPELCFSPAGQSRTLKACLIPSSVNNCFVQSEPESRWSAVDESALDAEEQEQRNNDDLQGLFDRLQHGGMRDSILKVVHDKAIEGLHLKEMYLSLERPCELVFAGSRGQKSQLVMRSDGSTPVGEEHLAEFAPLFESLPPEARRTGIDETLHRISRSVHAIARRTTGVTARVGRTIQGTVLPMMVNGASCEPLEALARACSRGLLIIGQPNVGKTTVLRELARLLSLGDKRIVVNC